jgi:integrase
MATRRGYGTGSVTFDHRGHECRDPRQHRNCTGRWRGEVSYMEDGKRKRIKVDAQTKTEVQDRLRDRLAEVRQGVKANHVYTVQQAVTDWLEHGLTSRAEATRTAYRDTVKGLLTYIGPRPLAKLTAMDVRNALAIMAEDRSTRTVGLAHNVLTRSIAMAVENGKVARNVAALVTSRPEGQTAGRESKAMTVDVALQLMRRCLAELDAGSEVDMRSPMVAAYTVLSWMTGIRTEEARALLWSEVDLSDRMVTIIRSARSRGRTKTEGSRRTLEIPEAAAEALRMWQEKQGNTDGHVFTTASGGQVDHHNMGEQFRRLCIRAGIGDQWVPRELRHSFVSALSAGGMPVEQIAWLAGHSTSRVTESVYRKELRPVLREGARVMGELLP